MPLQRTIATGFDEEVVSEQGQYFLSQNLPRMNQDACWSSVRDDLEKNVLKGVSRSFYITLRLLPLPMRGGASLGYLLARTSDTLADTTAAPLDARMKCLEQFGRAIAEDSAVPRWPLSFLNATENPRERNLLECTGDIFEWLRRLPVAEAELVREVLGIIVSGQKLDLERFATATRQHPIALADDSSLDDYAWRVAGCVGEFWTKLGFLTLGSHFSNAPEAGLLVRGRDYGKGLQLVNILRDLPEDLAAGRCYLPVSDPADHEALMACHAKWLKRTPPWIAPGRHDASALTARRLRAATALPALIAEKTLMQLGSANWEALHTRIRIPRKEVYSSLIRAFFIRPARSGGDDPLASQCVIGLSPDASPRCDRFSGRKRLKRVLSIDFM